MIDKVKNNSKRGEASQLYSLLDSGDGQKLEQFGTRILIRPSRLAVWNKRFPKDWSTSDATYVHQSGWKKRGSMPDEWQVKGDDFNLLLRLQTNGQVGLFPEHANYLAAVKEKIASVKASGEKPRVLNLFAFTGMATIAALQAGAEVVHVDLAKKAIEWARKNCELNSLASAPVRWIVDDALEFLRREAKRGNRYHVVIADPPSFSRPSAKEKWVIEEVVLDLVHRIAEVIDTNNGEIFLTSHHYESGSRILANILDDVLKERAGDITCSELLINEARSQRVLPAGFLTTVRVGGSNCFPSSE